MSVAPGSQEKHGYKSLLKIDLRRELDPPIFSRKPENVAFRGVSCMQMDAISSRTSRGDRSTGPAGSRLRDQLGPQGIRQGSTRGSSRVTRAGWLGVQLSTASEPPARQRRIWGVAFWRRHQPPLSCDLLLTGLLHHHRKSMNIKELRIWTWVNASDCPARSYAQSVAPGAVSSLLQATYVDQEKQRKSCPYKDLC